MYHAICKVCEIESPIHGIPRGYRLRIAVDNLARWNEKHQCFVPSFAAQYLITESGDYTEFDKDSFKKWIDKQKRFHMIDVLEMY